MSKNDQIALLLRKLQNVVVPSCVDVGEQLAYIAYKDKLVEEILEKISEPLSLSSKPEFVKIDAQKVAHDVISRTFDGYNQVMRKRVAKLESECEIWKKIALSNVKKSEEIVLPANSSNLDAPMIEGWAQTSFALCARDFEEQSTRFQDFESAWFKVFNWYIDVTNILINASVCVSDLFLDSFFILTKNSNFMSQTVSGRPAGSTTKKKEKNSIGLLPCVNTRKLDEKKRSFRILDSSLAQSSQRINSLSPRQKTSVLCSVHSMVLNQRKGCKGTLCLEGE